MKKTIIAIILLAMLTACAGEKEQEVTIESPFVGGTTGLEINFQETRTEVFDQGTDPFDIIIELKNKGEAEVKKDDITVSISGINPAQFDKTEAELTKHAPEDITQTKKDPEGTITEGPPTFIEFLSLNHKDKVTGASVQYPLRANVCYTYKTTAVTKICIRKNLLTPEKQGICEINEDKPVFNSGAPIQITNVKETLRSKDKIGFTFDIENQKTGLVFGKNTACERKERANEDKVHIKINTGLTGLTCTGLDSTGAIAEGTVTLYGGRRLISCTQTASIKTDFEQLVNIEATYDYEETVQTTITVKSSG